MVGKHTGIPPTPELRITPSHRDTQSHRTLCQHRNLGNHQPIRRNPAADSMVEAGSNRRSDSAARRPDVLCKTRGHNRTRLHFPVPSSPSRFDSQIQNQQIKRKIRFHSVRIETDFFIHKALERPSATHWRSSTAHAWATTHWRSSAAHTRTAATTATATHSCRTSTVVLAERSEPVCE